LKPSPDCWHLIYKFSSDTENLEIPERQNHTSRKDLLWQETCFELFIKKRSSSEYLEWNFSPSGNWALYHFEEYRKNPTKPQTLQPVIKTSYALESSKRNIRVEAAIPSPACIFGSNQYLVTICAITKFKTGEYEFWSLYHPSDKPDFHDQKSFVLEVGHD
jgi:hypothetical protein